VNRIRNGLPAIIREEVLHEMLTMARLWNWFKSDERGQGLAEYGLILVLVALAVVVALTAFGDQIAVLFGKVSTELSVP
jgi:pilus assembly protein Flp/PilA